MMSMEKLGEALLASAAFSAVGLIVFVIAFLAMNKLAPFSLRKEIEHDHNTALAIIMAAIIIGMALIVSSAVGA
jgi:putative membrane protein